MTWGCENFADFVLGHQFEIEKDHKPLAPLLSTKHLDNLPPSYFVLAKTSKV